MQSFQIQDILSKISELRAVFVLGQRAVPFLEDIFYFLKDISPLLEEVSASMRDTAGQMPHAADQLQSVTKATEMATVEILDLVDAVFGDLGQIQRALDESVEHVDHASAVDDELLAFVRERLSADDLAAFEQIHARKVELRATVEAALGQKAEAVKAIRAKLNQIMISLQVQDITSQQIAAVNSLIGNIRDRMADLATKMQETTEDNPVTGLLGLESGQTFDANARYDRSGQRQHEADQIADAFAGGAASAGDIDALFGGGDAASAAASEPVSADDIDALFGGAAEPASPDDIDHLFGT